jgi:CheY-like chemotaxis protein
MQRIIVVDDQPTQRTGRVQLLSRVPGAAAEGMTFEQAMALGQGWSQVQIAVLDGYDRRSAARRVHAAAEAGIPPLAPHDNLLGVRVAMLIRQHCTSEQTKIIMVSTHARDSDLRARRIAQAGVDYVFEHYEVERDEDSFVRAVLSPEAFSPQRESANWPTHDYAGIPNVAAAIAAMEASPAGSMLLADELHKRHKDQEWELRALRQRLHKFLPGQLAGTDTGIRKPRAPRKAWLSAQLRQALGKDLPVDPD